MRDWVRLTTKGADGKTVEVNLALVRQITPIRNEAHDKGAVLTYIDGAQWSVEESCNDILLKRLQPE